MCSDRRAGLVLARRYVLYSKRFFLCPSIATMALFSSVGEMTDETGTGIDDGWRDRCVLLFQLDHRDAVEQHRRWPPGAPKDTDLLAGGRAVVSDHPALFLDWDWG